MLNKGWPQALVVIKTRFRNSYRGTRLVAYLLKLKDEK